jgi:hypothetical protein
MKNQGFIFRSFICLAFISCETFGMNLGEIFSPVQSNSTNGSQGNGGTPLGSHQSSGNTTGISLSKRTDLS